jgi:cytochrome d ubiquinol oxidase subunit II
VWDVGFAVGSTLPALLFGVAIGNVLRGLPLDEAKNFTGSFFSLLNPYSLLLGVTGLAMFATHGATYLALRTTGDLAERARGWGRKACAAYLALLVVATGTTIVVQPHLLTNYGALPALWVVPVITLLCTVMIGVFNGRGKALQAFLASSLSIVGVMVLIAIGLFPNLVPALNDPRLSLTITNASSSELTLKVMFIVALLGMPIVLAYTAWVYYIFRGKVGAESPGY